MLNTFFKNMLCCAFLITQVNLLWAQEDPAFSDPAFNDGNTAYYIPSPNRNTFYDLVVSEDGGIIMAGVGEPETWNFDFAAIRLRANGQIDSTFGDNGVSLIDFKEGNYDDRCHAAALQSDERIVLAGVSNDHGRMVRLNRDGSIDSAFVFQNTGSPAINDILITGDDKIIAAGVSGFSDIFVSLYNADGRLDESFAQQGSGSYNVGAGIDEEEVQIILQDDGKIIVTGRVDNRNFAVRVNTGGAIDSSYAANGIAWVDMVYSSTDGEQAAAALQSDGKLIMAGSRETGSFYLHKMSAARLNTDGSIDSTFGQNGYATVTETPLNASFKEAEARFVLIDDNDFIYLGGRKAKSTGWWNFAITRLTPDGQLDSTFADNGYAYTGGSGIGGVAGSGETITAMAWDNDKIVAGGEFYVNRFLTGKTATGMEKPAAQTVRSFQLGANYPNPFNPVTTIPYTLGSAADVTLRVFDVSGRRVAEYHYKNRAPGNHRIRFNGFNLSSGLYFYRLIVEGNISANRRMILLK